MKSDLAHTIAAIIDPVAWDRAGQVGPGRRALKPSDRTEKMDKTRRDGSMRMAMKIIEAFETHFLDPHRIGDLSWNVIANLRWLANNHGLRHHLPCGMLPGAFLLIVANRLEASTNASKHMEDGHADTDGEAAEMFAHLNCTTCGGSGHIDDTHAPAAVVGGDGLIGAVQRFLADYDDGDRAEAGNNPLMAAHVSDFRNLLALSQPAADAIQTGDGVLEGQDARRSALIERLGYFADLLSSDPLDGEKGDLAYDLIRQAAAQISSDRLRLAALQAPSALEAQD